MALDALLETPQNEDVHFGSRVREQRAWIDIPAAIEEIVRPIGSIRAVCATLAEWALSDHAVAIRRGRPFRPNTADRKH